MTALAIRDDQTGFDNNQIAVLRAAGVDEDVADAELAAFLHVCQRRALDPFTKQIYLIGRWDNQKRRKVYAHQTSIDGFRLIARRSADKAGIDYEYEDTIWYADDGSTHEAWLWNTPPAAAKVVVVRGGRRFDAVARFGAYAQRKKDGALSGQWGSMPEVMIAKCAEALALRKAFPEDLSGLYTSDEMGQADNPQTVQAQAERVDAKPKPKSGPVTDDEWFRDITERIVALDSKAVAQQLWTEINTKRDDRQCIPEDVTDLRKLIAARVEAVEAQDAAQGNQENPDDDVVDGQIVDDPMETHTA